MKKYLMLLALLCAAVHAQAQTANGYVIYSSDDGYFLTHNDATGAVSTAAVTAFDVSTCLWTISGNYIRPVSNNGTTVLGSFYLRPRTGNNNYSLNTNTSANYADWSGGLSNGGQPYYGTNRYLRLTGTSGNNPSWQIGNNDSHRGTLYAVTRYDVAASLSDFEINGPNVLSGNGNYSHTNAGYLGSYYDYQFNGTHNYAGRPDPVEVTTGYTWSLSGAAGYAGVDPATGTITVTSFPANDIEMTLTCSVTNHGLTKTATKTITLQGTTVAAPTITRSGNSVTLATATTGATIYYTTDGSTPSSSSAVYSGPINIANLSFPVTVKAIAIRNGNSSDPASETYSQPACEMPVITVSSTGVVTITCATEGATIHYTSGTSPADPTGSSPEFSSLTLTSGQSVKAIATKSGYITSAIATAEYVQSGVSGGKVTLDDRENHSWSYYSDASTPEQLHSLNPADVKITYYGDGIMMTGTDDYTASSTDFVQPGNANYVGGAKVNVGGENENTFVYYKTLERANADGSGRCPYKPIPNPFQVRPTYGTRGSTDANDFTGWRGFQCWRLKSVTGGAVYSVASGGTALTTGAVINAETEIYFAPTAEYGMEVELEAVWAIAYVKKANQANENPVGTNNVGYERNFCVPTTGAGYTLYTGNGKRITNANHIPVTISCYYPDGTAPDNTANSISNTATSLTGDTKFENILISLTSNTLTLDNYDIIVGRGCGTSTINTLQAINGNVTDLDYTIRLESGTVNNFSFVRTSSCTVSGRYMVRGIMGSDYDRAKGDNDKLSISPNSTLFFSTSVTFSGASNKDQKTFDCVFKSGKYQSQQWNGTTQSGQQGYQHVAYLGQNSAGNTYAGVRYVTVEGGEFSGMCGGRGVGSESTTYMTPDVITFDLRIKGGTFHGAVYGGAADNPSIGSRRFIMTGGEIQSWIAGGCNGTGSTTGTGATNGDSYIYVGGTTLVGGDNPMTINETNGGQVFGAGRGISGRASSVNHSHVAIADEAVVCNNNNTANIPIGGNVYGGSYNGTIADVSNVYILGGRVEGSAFGGSYGNGTAIPTVNVKMTGGLVTNGVYGGSNNTGTISGNVTMHIDGGTVGNSEIGDGVFGGGYGQPTIVSGNINVTLGASTSATDSATVNGNVYGGSALGSVNTNTSNTTVVTMNKALINGNLFGGAYGNGAQVRGYITVNVNGGFVNGSVFGGGDAAAYGTAGWNYPVVNMTGGTAVKVFGGGKGNTATVTGNPKVTLSGNAHVTENVYGGGDAAVVTGETSVILRD